MKTMKPFNQAMSELLADRDVSISEAARRMRKKVGWGSKQTISACMSGRDPLTTDLMEGLAAALEVKPEFFAEYRMEMIRRKLWWRTPEPGNNYSHEAFDSAIQFLELMEAGHCPHCGEAINLNGEGPH